MNPAEFANIAAAERDLWWYRGMQRILFRLLDPIARAHRFERVLDAGCGTGYLAARLEDRYRWPMTALDADSRGLTYARRLGLARLTQASITSLPFRDSCFDAVLSMDVIPHLRPGEERAAFAEFARVLQPGGFLILRAAAFDSLRSNHSRFINERQRFRLRQLRDLAHGAGFAVERATYANAFLLPVALFKFRVWEPLVRQNPASGVAPVAPWLDGLLSVPLRFEAALIGAGVPLPAGQSAILIARKRSAPSSDVVE